MYPNICFVWLLVITPRVSCSFDLCNTSQNSILSDEECSELYFQPSEKETNLGNVKLELERDSFNITPREASFSAAFIRITPYKNKTEKFCSKLSSRGAPNCVKFTPETANQTFLLEYRIEKLPEAISRKFLFSLAAPRTVPLFPYIDLTDTSRLILKAQKLPPTINITYYKIEAYKEKNNNTNLEDLRFFPFYEEISFELFTYNDEGNYYFTILAISDGCVEEQCPRMTTPKVLLGRKSTRLVIGIVGASFILPFVLFIFHILTKKYPIEADQSDSEGRIVVVYKSSFKKHNDVVIALATLLEKLAKNHINVDVIDLSKTTKKFPDRFCIDSLILATRIIYVAPPKNDAGVITVDKAMSEKEIYGVMFDYSMDKLPQFFDNHKIFKLFEDFDKFISALNISGYDNALYMDLKRKTEEAKTETEKYSNEEILPKIVVTNSELQERESLISPKVDL